MANSRNYRVPGPDDDADVPYWNDLLAKDVANDVAGIDVQVQGIKAAVPQTVENIEYAEVTTDADGRISEGIRMDGKKYLASAVVDKADVKDLHASTLTADSFSQAGQSVATVDYSGYSRLTTDADGRIAEDALDGGGRVPAWILEAWAGRMTPLMKAALGITPERKLAAFGDSMTFGLGGSGTTYVGTAAADLGLSHYNGGISSQTSSEIALRQGGLAVLVTAAGNSIPASGPVTVTVSPASSWRAGSAWTFPGTLAGIPGTLAKSAAEVWTFTRTTAGTATICPAGSRFISATATPYNGWISLLWAGRNNTTQSIIERDVAAMVASLTPVKTRYLVFGICNTSGEVSGSAGHTNILAINAALSATYGDRFFDVRRYIIDYGLAAAGISPTAADTTALNEDRMPPSLMSDTIHLNAAGYAVVGHRVAAILTEKGWNL